jgi:hypothetical protein
MLILWRKLKKILPRCHFALYICHKKSLKIEPKASRCQRPAAWALVWARDWWNTFNYYFTYLSIYLSICPSVRPPAPSRRVLDSRCSFILLDLSIWCSWLVSFMFGPLYSHGKSLRYPLVRRLGGPSAGLEVVQKRKFLTLPGLELRTLGRPAHSQPLYRLRYPVSIYIYTGLICISLRHEMIVLDHHQLYTYQFCKNYFTVELFFHVWTRFYFLNIIICP